MATEDAKPESTLIMEQEGKEVGSDAPGLQVNKYPREEQKHEESLPMNDKEEYAKVSNDPAVTKIDPEILHSGADELDETKAKFSEIVSMEGDDASPDHTVPKEHDETEEGKSGHSEVGTTVEPEDNKAESSLVRKSLEIIKQTDHSHVSLPLEQASPGEESPSVTPIQEQKAVKRVEEELNDAHNTTVENTPKEEILEVQRTDEQNNITEQVEKDKPNQDLKSSTEETCLDSEHLGDSVHDIKLNKEQNKETEDKEIQEKKHEEPLPENYQRNDPEILHSGVDVLDETKPKTTEFSEMASMEGDDISPDHTVPKEHDESEEGKPASTEAGGSLQEFQSHVQADEVPETVKELLEVSIPTTSKEIVVPQVSEEKSVDQEVTEKENDTMDRYALQMKPEKEEASADKALDTSDISPREEHQEAIKSEDIDYEPGLASKDETTKQEQEDKESIIETAEESAAGEIKSVAENESQTVEYHNVDQPLEDSSTEVTSLDLDRRIAEAVFETNVAKVSLAEALGDSLEEMPSVNLPNQETALTSSEGKSDGTDTDENIVYAEITDREQNQSLENRSIMTDEQVQQATESLSIGDQNCESQQDTPTSQELSKESEISDENDQIEDNIPEQESSLETNQKDEQKQEADPNADVLQISNQSKESEPTEDTQSLTTEAEIQDKDDNVSAQVSFEEPVNCISVQEGHMPDDALVPHVDSELKVDDTSDVNTKLEDTEKACEEPSQVSTEQKSIECSPAEEGGKVDDLKSEEYPGAIQNEMPETISSESEIVKMTDSQEMTDESKFIITEEPHAVSTPEEREIHTIQEKEEKITNDVMAEEELNTKANEKPELLSMDASQITKEISEVQRTDDQNKTVELEGEDKPNQDLTSSTDENQNSKEEYINQEAENGNSPPEEVNRDIGPSSLAVEEETAKPASTEAGGSLQEFQSHVQADEVPETVKELLEVSIPTTSKEIVVPQVSEEKSVDQEATEKENDITDRYALQMKPEKEEASADKALDTSDISPREEHQEAIKSEDMDYEPGLASKDRTTKQEQENKESIIEKAEECAAGETKSVAENESQTVEYQNVDQPLEDSSIDCRSTETVFETNVAKVSSAEALGDSLEEMPSVKLPNQETALTSSEGKSDGTDTDENIVYEATDASLATSLKEELFQNEGYQNLEAEDAKITDREQNQSLENQSIMIDEQDQQATEPLSIGDQNCKSPQDTPTSQELSKESEIHKEKHATDENDIEDNIPEQESSLETNQKDEEKQEADPNADVLRISNQSKESETTEDTQSLTTEVEIQDKDDNKSAQVSFEEPANCISVQEGSDVMDNVSLNTKLEDTEKACEEPSKVSTEQKSIECTPAEEGGKVDDLKSEEYPGAIQNEMPETISSDSEIVKMTDSQEMTDEDKFIITEVPHTVSTPEDREIHTFQEKDEKITNDVMAKDELKANVNEKPELLSMDASQITKVVFDEAPQTPNSQETVERKEDGNLSNTTTTESKTEIDSNEDTKLVETDMVEATQSLKNQVDEEPNPGLTAQETINFTPPEEEKDEGHVTNSTKDNGLNSQIYTKVAKDEVFETTNSENPGTEMIIDDKAIIIESPQQFSTSEETVHYDLPGEEKINIHVQETAIEELSETRIDEAPGTTHSSSESAEVTIDAQKELKQGEDMAGAEEIMENLPEGNYEEGNVDATDIPAEVKPDVAVSEISEPIINSDGSTQLEELETSELNWTFNKQIASENCESNVQVTRSIEGNPNIEGDETSETSGTAKLEETSVVDATQISENQTSSEDQIDEEPFQVVTTEKTINHTSAEYPGGLQNEMAETISSESEIVKMTDSQEMTDENKFIITEVPHAVSTPEEREIHTLQDKEEKITNDIMAEDELNAKVNEKPELLSMDASQITKVVFDEETVERKEDGNLSNTTTKESKAEIDSNEDTKPVEKDMAETTNSESPGTEMIIDDKAIIIESPQQFPTSQETVHYDLQREENMDIHVQETARKELSETRIDEAPGTTHSSSESEEVTIDAQKELKQGEGMAGGEEIMENLPEEKNEEANVDATDIPAEVKLDVAVSEISEPIINSDESTQVEQLETSVRSTVEVHPEIENGESNAQVTRSIEGIPNIEGDETSETTETASATTNLEETDIVDATQKCENQTSSEDQIDEEPEKTINHTSAEADTEEVKHEKISETADEQLMFQESQMTSEETIEERRHVSTAEELGDYSPAKEESININDTTVTDELNQKEHKTVEVPSQDSSSDKISIQEISDNEHKALDELKIGGKLNDTADISSMESEDTKLKKEHEVVDVTESVVEKDMPAEDSSLEIPCNSPVVEEVITDNPEDKDEEESIVNVAEMISESKSEDTKFDEAKIKNTTQSFEEKCSGDDKVAEGKIPEGKEEMDIKDGMSTLEQTDEVHSTETETTAKTSNSKDSSTEVESEPNLFTTEGPSSDTIPKIASQGEEVAIKQMDSADEILHVEVEEMHDDASQAVPSNEVKKEEKIEELVKLSSPTNLREMHEHENDSATEIQNEPDSSTKIEQNNYLPVLQDPTEVHAPFESSIQVSDVGNMEKEDPNTGNDAKITGQEEEEMTLIHPTDGDESLQPEVEKMDPEVSSIMPDSSSKEQETAGIEDSKISDADLDMEIAATKVSKTGSETKIASQEKEMPTLEKSLVGETLQTETKKLEPESTSNDKMGANAKEHVQHSDQESAQNADEEEQSLNNRPTDELPEIKHEEAKEETTKSASEESMASLEDLLQTPITGNIKAGEDSKIENEPIIPGNDAKEGDKPYSDEDKGEAESDSPVLVEASRDADVKITPKKSNNILSGVGSKVKNSIAKVKKVITGKSSSPKPSSPT